MPSVRPVSDVERSIVEVVERDRRDLIELALELGRMPSPHGGELPVAERVRDWLEAEGIETWLQPITATSANVVGRLPGAGDGKSLIIDAHLDTGPAVPPDAPERIRRIHGAWEEDGMLYGYGVINDKAQVAAGLLAARAIARSGVRLAGDLIIAGVAFETGAPSYGDDQGIDFPGEGFGTWWLVNRGVTADYALIGETSGFGLVTAECGELGVELIVRGRNVYTPRLERGTGPLDHPTSIPRVAALVSAIEEWAVVYEQERAMDFWGGRIVPRAQIISIDAAREHSSIQLDIRLVPGANPREVQRSLERALRTSGVEFEARAFQWSRGYLAEQAGELIDAVTDAHGAVLGGAPPQPPVSEMSMWRDLNIFNELGIPSICYGPPRQREEYSDARNRAMLAEDLVSTTKVYALTALSICGAA